MPMFQSKIPHYSNKDNVLNMNKNRQWMEANIVWS